MYNISYLQYARKDLCHKINNISMLSWTREIFDCGFKFVVYIILLRVCSSTCNFDYDRTLDGLKV